MVVKRPRDDLGYFHARAIEEQAAAQRATCAAARSRHEEMAAMYRFKEMFATRGGEAERTDHLTTQEFRSGVADQSESEPAQADSTGNPASTAPLNAPKLYTSV
jgi:hypothetical protein